LHFISIKEGATIGLNKKYFAFDLPMLSSLDNINRLSSSFLDLKGNKLTKFNLRL
jgi:hypothetical protein